MAITDKRLIDKMTPAEKEKYLNEIENSIPIADEKFEECEVGHEPVDLLNKIQGKQSTEPEDEETPETTEDQTSPGE
jgi:hypothetical protein